MAGAVLMNVIIDMPTEQLGRRARVEYCCRALQLTIQELSAGGGMTSSGSIVGQSASGQPHTDLGYWGFNNASEP
jgi:hypothetical protein